jgi:alpha-L-fucosidase
MVAHLYNVSAQLHGGATEAIYTSKTATDCAIGTCLLDHERGVSDAIAARIHGRPTRASGQWHYKRGQKYKTPKKVIDLLTDIVSKNGNLLLNFPLPNSGELDFEEMDGAGRHHRMDAGQQRRHLLDAPLEDLRRRPIDQGQDRTGNFNEDKQTDLTAEDVRFTAKGSTLYAFVQGWPAKGGRGAGARPGEPAAARQDPQGGTARHKGDAQLEAGRFRIEGPDARGEISDIGITLKVRTSQACQQNGLMRLPWELGIRLSLPGTGYLCFLPAATLAAA